MNNLKQKSAPELLDLLNAVEEELHSRFGYAHDWRIFPTVDSRHYWWMTNGGIGGVVVYGKTAESVTNRGDDHCQDEIYTYRHLKQWVWETPELTMILVDTRTDGNVWLAVLDNAKKLEWVEES